MFGFFRNKAKKEEKAARKEPDKKKSKNGKSEKTPANDDESSSSEPLSQTSVTESAPMPSQPAVVAAAAVIPIVTAINAEETNNSAKTSAKIPESPIPHSSAPNCVESDSSPITTTHDSRPSDSPEKIEGSQGNREVENKAQTPETLPVNSGVVINSTKDKTATSSASNSTIIPIISVTSYVSGSQSVTKTLLDTRTELGVTAVPSKPLSTIKNAHIVSTANHNHVGTITATTSSNINPIKPMLVANVLPRTEKSVPSAPPTVPRTTSPPKAVSHTPYMGVKVRGILKPKSVTFDMDTTTRPQYRQFQNLKNKDRDSFVSVGPAAVVTNPADESLTTASAGPTKTTTAPSINSSFVRPILSSYRPSLGLGLGQESPSWQCSPSIPLELREAKISPVVVSAVQPQPGLLQPLLEPPAPSNPGIELAMAPTDVPDPAELQNRLKQLEELLRERNERLQQLEEAVSQNGDAQQRLEEMERLENELAERDAIDAEREEELRILTEALEEALEEKAELEQKISQDSGRETQLLEDFEWKLREIEREYKAKLSEAEAAAAEGVRQELLQDRAALIEEKKRVEDQIKQVAHLKSYEVEAIQLRGLVNEQQRALRVAARQIDALKLSEKSLQDELKSRGGYNTNSLPRKPVLDEETLNKKLEQERKALNAHWEEKTKLELQTLKSQMENCHLEEKRMALDALRLEKDTELQNLRKTLEAKQRELVAELSTMKDTLSQKEVVHTRRMEEQKALAERDICSMRRDLTKLQDSHFDEMERLKQKHEEERQNFQEKIDSLAEEVKEAMKNELAENMEALQKQHQGQLQALQEHFEEEKQQAFSLLEAHYRSQAETVQEQNAFLRKQIEHFETQNSELQRLSELLESREEEVKFLREEVRVLQISSKAEIAHDARSPPLGRGTGDGRSPSPSHGYHSYSERSHFEYGYDAIESHHAPWQRVCCDPDHLEAQQFVLELQQVLADREAELQRLTEEKRFYQLELINWERNLFNVRPGPPLTLKPEPEVEERGYSAPPVTKPRLWNPKSEYESSMYASSSDDSCISYYSSPSNDMLAFPSDTAFVEPYAHTSPDLNQNLKFSPVKSDTAPEEVVAIQWSRQSPPVGWIGPDGWMDAKEKEEYDRQRQQPVSTTVTSPTTGRKFERTVQGCWLPTRQDLIAAGHDNNNETPNPRDDEEAGGFTTPVQD